MEICDEESKRFFQEEIEIKEKNDLKKNKKIENDDNDIENKNIDKNNDKEKNKINNKNKNKNKSKIKPPARWSPIVMDMNKVFPIIPHPNRPSRPKLYVPPLNFSMVSSGVYRSGHPIPINYSYLEKLKLKTIVYLGEMEIIPEYKEWAETNGIKLLQFEAHSVKEPFFQNNSQAIESCLNIILDSRNFPILIHSNKGKHRVGVLVGAMRKLLQGWSIATIFDEYGRFAAGKEAGDVEFIELFNVEKLEYDVRFAPSWFVTRPEIANNNKFR